MAVVLQSRIHMDESKSTRREFAPLPYHREMVEFLQRNEAPLWNWYASAGHKEKYADAIRLDLLKSTYRLERSAHEPLYAAADHVAKEFGLSIPITLYQAQVDDRGHNAGICCLPGEAHIVLRGDILSVLNELETRALLGHELSHYRFWWGEDEKYAIASRILDAVACDSRCPGSFELSALRFRRYTEIYADRGALLACNNLDSVVACLVKITTGLREISPAAYMSQADEIFAKGSVTDQGMTHPETFIRARALKMWSHSEQDTDAAIRQMIEGDLQLDRLDLLGQRGLSESTRTFIADLLRPIWFRSETVLAHARLFFSDFKPVQDASAPTVYDKLKPLSKSAVDYYCYLLMDFAVADPALDDLPLARALEVADKINARERLEELAYKELKITKKNLARLRQEGPELLAKAGGAS